MNTYVKNPIDARNCNTNAFNDHNLHNTVKFTIKIPLIITIGKIKNSKLINSNQKSK